MVFENLDVTTRSLLEIAYNHEVKVFLLFGFWLLSLFYIFYLSKNQEKTKLLLVATARASLYAVSYFYSWLFFLIYPVMVHPAVGVDSLLIFLSSIYGIIFTVAFVIFITNSTLFIWRFVLKRGNVDLDFVESNAFKYHFDFGFKRNGRKKRYN